MSAEDELQSLKRHMLDVQRQPHYVILLAIHLIIYVKCINSLYLIIIISGSLSFQESTIF